MKKINEYTGNEHGQVSCNGTPLNPQLGIYNHSPSGFSWGYCGSGPAQLALAIMVNEFGRDLATHPIHYQQLNNGIIAGLPKTFTFSASKLDDFIAAIQTKR